MTITLYTVTDPTNKLTKTLGTPVANYTTAVIKDNCTIQTPVVVLPYSTGIFSANYMYISDFGRYYFIDTIETEHERVFIRAHCDVLMSFNAEIKEISAYIERSENLYNLYLNDKAFRTQNNRLPDVTYFKNATDSFTPEGEYILCVAGPAELPAENEAEGGNE